VYWSVVVPVKRVEKAKTRLRDAVPGADHEALVLALAADTVRAVLASAPVDWGRWSYRTSPTRG
jgi:2-phospho-L-lactate guanylyltransferase